MNERCAKHEVRGTVVLIILFFLTGCAKVSHLDQLLTLKDLSEEQDSLQRYIQEQDRKFEFLLQAVEDGTIQRYTKARRILKDFGEPVYKEEMTRENPTVQRWVYRYARRFFGSPKVCLYVDAGGRLLRWEILADADEDQSHPSGNL